MTAIILKFNSRGSRRGFSRLGPTCFLFYVQKQSRRRNFCFIFRGPSSDFWHWAPRPRASRRSGGGRVEIYRRSPRFLSARGGGGGAAANRAISLCISYSIYLRVANIAASAFYFLGAAIFIALPAKNIRRASD
jgi:hypothetical protein